MSWIDWLIALVPAAFVIFMGFYSRRYIVGVSDYLVAGRVGRRYMLTTADTLAALGLVTVVMYVEVYYKTGFSLAFFQTILLPITVILGLLGYMSYRFRETRAMSIGQLLEMRYCRSLRIFACFLRIIADILANVIMPAIAARFFIAYLDLPPFVNLFGWQCPTFMIVVFVTLALAISLILAGGTLSILVTNTLQSVIVMPLLLVFIIFVLYKFNWGSEVAPVLIDRAPGESFINPYDVSHLRDFNIFTLLCVPIVHAFLHGISGASGSQNSCKSAHEGKMAKILSTWSNAFTVIFYIVIALSIIIVMNHKNYADDAKAIRTAITSKIVEDPAIATPAERAKIVADVSELPPNIHNIGVDAPLSQSNTLDDKVFATAHETFGHDGVGNSKMQQFKTLFRQMMLPMAMRQMLPVGMIGLFCLMIILFIISTDDSRIFGAVTIMVQDCVVPFVNRDWLTPERHIKLIKIFAILVGLIYLVCSYYMAQLDYIKMFVDGVFGVWLAGCGPMFVFGLYSRFGTSAGAWVSLVSGSLLNLIGLIIRFTWAGTLYPFIKAHGWVEPLGNFLEKISFKPYLVFKMDELVSPINPIEWAFFATMVSLISYVVVSWLTYKEPFNLERMLHRGKYATEGEKPLQTKWTIKNVFGKLIGITPEYTKGDKVIAWGVFAYTYGYKFFLCFVVVVICNAISPWRIEWWSSYFLITSLVVPGVMAAITSVWFAWGGTRDLLRCFKELKGRVANPLDNGMVEGGVSLDEEAVMAKIDEQKKEK